MTPLGLADLPPGERPRERLWEKGAGALSLAELLAILLGTGTRDRDVLALAGDLVEAFGGLSGLARAAGTELLAFRGLGKAKAAHVAAALELARRYQKELLPRGERAGWQGRLEEIAAQVAHEEREFVYVLFLNRRGVLLEEGCLSFGGLEGAYLDMPYLFRRGVRLDATRFVLAHNHPDGDPSPSQEDRALTEHVSRRLPLLGMELEGHFVLARGRCVRVSPL